MRDRHKVPNKFNIQTTSNPYQLSKIPNITDYFSDDILMLQIEKKCFHMLR